MNDFKEIRWKQRYVNFKKAYIQLKKAMDQFEHLDDLSKEGLIQRFEYTFELAWKTLKDFLESKGVQVKFPNDVIRAAFKSDILDDGEIWLDMLEQRNILANTYDEENFHKSLHIIKNQYFEQISKLIDYLNNEQ